MNQTMVYKFLVTHQIRDPIHKDNNLQEKEFIWGGAQFQGFLFMVKLAPLLPGLGEPEHHGGEDRMEPRFSPHGSQETQRDGEGSG